FRFCWRAWRFRPQRRQLFRRRTAAIAEVTRQKGTTPFRASPPANTIQQLVLIHSAGPPPALSTRPSVLPRSGTTLPATPTRPLVVMRFLGTDLGTTPPLSVTVRCIITPSVT